MRHFFLHPKPPLVFGALADTLIDLTRSRIFIILLRERLGEIDILADGHKVLAIINGIDRPRLAVTAAAIHGCHRLAVLPDGVAGVNEVVLTFVLSTLG